MPFFGAQIFRGVQTVVVLKIAVQDSTPQILVVMELTPGSWGGGVGGSQELETVSHLELRWLMEL